MSGTHDNKTVSLPVVGVCLNRIGKEGICVICMPSMKTLKARMGSGSDWRSSAINGSRQPMAAG